MAIDAEAIVNAWLLLEDQRDGRGVAIAVRPPELMSDLPDTDVERLRVASAAFIGESGGPAAASLAKGGTLALRWIAERFRGVWISAPLLRLSIRSVDPLPEGCDGDSAELLYALMTFLRLVSVHGLADVPDIPLAATGTLDEWGVVGPVDAVLPKLEAAIATMPWGSIVFYPRETRADGTPSVTQAMAERAIRRVGATRRNGRRVARECRRPRTRGSSETGAGEAIGPTPRTAIRGPFGGGTHATPTSHQVEAAPRQAPNVVDVRTGDSCPLKTPLMTERQDDHLS